MLLEIIIIRAGLVGLSTAIALGRQGHQVELYETSSLSKEIGATFHVAPQAHKILRAWGVDTDPVRPNVCLRWQYPANLKSGANPTQPRWASVLVLDGGVGILLR